MTKRIILLIIVALSLTVTAFCEEARDITGIAKITSDTLNVSRFTDGKVTTFSSGENAEVSIVCDEEIYGIWLRYSAAPHGGRLNSMEICKDGFWSEYIPLDGVKEIELSFDEVSLTEISLYSSGELPSEVQRFEVAQYETDLMLFASHSDDDQLFFAGLLPYYIARGADVKVCFFTTSYQEISRVHELLAGLWHCGVKSYPVILPLPDEYSESFDGAKRILEGKGYAYEEIMGMISDVLNTYKPQVVVLHDFKGEYGHGTHIFATRVIVDAIENAAEGAFIPSKVYVHLYEERRITLPIDEPLEAFGGKSAFNVSQEAFQNHKSQHWTWFYGWIYGKNGSITKASQIKSYSPLYYGLYLSSVGEDSENDMLCNIETYEEQRVRKLYELCDSLLVGIKQLERILK